MKRFLWLEREQPARDANISDLTEAFRKGDRLVVNDAATVPSSFKVQHAGRRLELRLAGLVGEGNSRRWRAVLFGEGDWRTPTEERPEPPKLAVGAELRMGRQLAKVTKVESETSERLLEIEFAAETDWGELWSEGRPVQYAYSSRALQDWDQQTLFSRRPMAVEPPSASFALSWELVFALRAKGVEIVSISHATGLSDTGDARINAKLPFPELSIVSVGAEARLRKARAENARIIALGTGVVRCLEAWAWRDLKGRSFMNDLKITRDRPLAVVTGLFTGLHESGSSHLDLLSAFVDREKLERAYGLAKARGYKWHEYGDYCLVI